ncbi:MAG: hypothetical protein LBQ46_06505 [Treponema sp.]|jgi:hypothetical protein|nr:hypothetical protein [Treponema sp.]
MPNPGSEIGTRRESALHRALKFRYSGQNGCTEQILGDYVCDGLTETGEIIEVQTGSFGPLREKAEKLAAQAPLRIVHPVIITRYIETYDSEGVLLRRRKSPRRGSPWDLFKNLLYAPELPLRRGLCIELALVDVLEKRVEDGKGSWRRGGVSITGRELAGWHDSIILKKPRDYRRFVPLAQDFTVSSLAEEAGISPNLARKTLYVLHKMGVVERTGKAGRAFTYRLKGPKAAKAPPAPGPSPPTGTRLTAGAKKKR